MDGMEQKTQKLGPHKYVQVIADNKIKRFNRGKTDFNRRCWNKWTKKKKSTETSNLIQKVHQNRSYTTCKMKDNKI